MPDAYTDIPKPTRGQITIQVGMATGLLTPPTYSTEHAIGDADYTNVSKPTGTPYTDVAKPTT